MSKKTRQQEVRGSGGPVPAKSKQNKQPNRSGQPDRTVFEPNAAGIDIGAREIYVAVPPDRDEHPVRKCETFTGDLHQMALSGPLAHAREGQILFQHERSPACLFAKEMRAHISIG